MPHQVCPTNINFILIKLPENQDIKALYNAPDAWFSTFSNKVYLKIYLNPEEYIMLREGESAKYIRSFKIPVLPIRYKEVGFIATIADDNFILRCILEEIIATSIDSSKQKHNSIQVIDYVKPNREDVKIALATALPAFTVRNGTIDLEPGSGTTGSGKMQFSTNGIRFTFRESALAFI